jgi:hypothetical protein
MVLLAAFCATLSISAQPKLVAPKKGGSQAAGQIDVKSINAGAKVFVDDKAVGTTPMVVKGIVPGEHKVKVKKLGYLAGEVVVKVEPEKTASVQIDLLPYAGVLTVKTTPKGAQVFVDGKGVGVVPYEGEISIGRRSVEVKKDGFVTFREVFQVGAGEIYKIETTLQKGHDAPTGDVPLAAVAPKKKKTDQQGDYMDIPLEAPPALTPISKTPTQGPLSGGTLGMGTAANEPIYKKWWLWTIVGVVVAGGVVASVVIVTQAGQPQQPQQDFTATLNFAR